MAQALRNQNPAERVKKAIEGNPNGPSSCNNCGSTFFTQQSAHQHSVSNYGVRVISVSPQTFHVCVGCGESVVPSNLQNMANKGGEREAFIQSIELGKAYRAKHDVASLIKNTASISELNELREQYLTLKELVDGVLEILASQEGLEAELETEQDKEPDPVYQDKPEKITKKNLGKGK